MKVMDSPLIRNDTTKIVKCRRIRDSGDNKGNPKTANDAAGHRRRQTGHDNLREYLKEKENHLLLLLLLFKKQNRLPMANCLFI